MIVFVGHTLLLSCVSFYVDDISYTVVDEVCGQLDGAMLCSEFISINFLHLVIASVIAPLKPRLNMWRVRAR